MPQFHITSNPTNISQNNTQPGVLTNNGTVTVYLDDETSVSQESAGLTLLPFQSVNWSDGVLWAVTKTGEVGSLQLQYGANTTVSPVTSISGPVQAIIEGTVDAVLTGPITAEISGPVEANVSGDVSITGGIIQATNGIELLGIITQNSTTAQKTFDTSKYASVMLIPSELSPWTPGFGPSQLTLDLAWRADFIAPPGSDFFPGGDTWSWDEKSAVVGGRGSMFIADVKSRNMLVRTGSYTGWVIAVYGSRQALTPTWSHGGANGAEPVQVFVTPTTPITDLTPVYGFSGVTRLSTSFLTMGEAAQVGYRTGSGGFFIVARVNGPTTVDSLPIEFFAPRAPLYIRMSSVSTTSHTVTFAFSQPLY